MKSASNFPKALVTKLLTYALGRSLELADDPLIEELAPSLRRMIINFRA